jgi:metal-dependent HD superfamily phosphatase/phosphodiesterase
MTPKSKYKLSNEIVVDTENNQLASRVLQLLNTNEEIQTLWLITNLVAIKRLSITDHGITHFQIVANHALKIARMLAKNKVKFSICQDFGLSQDYAELVILLTSLLHDMGMSINRQGHEEFSVMLVNNLLRELLAFMPTYERTIVISETLHAIISHRRNGRPLTVEAGIVRVADALDMSQGRTRMPYEEGKIDIHAVSAMAIDQIDIKPNHKFPVQIDVTMNHSAGLFQVDELLEKKVAGSGIEQYLEINIYIDQGKGKILFKDFFKK